jgi:hypothetical protein
VNAAPPSRGTAGRRRLLRSALPAFVLLGGVGAFLLIRERPPVPPKPAPSLQAGTGSSQAYFDGPDVVLEQNPPRGPVSPGGGSEMAGIVRNASGAPVSGALVTAVASNSPAVALASGLAGEDGRFRFLLPRGRGDVDLVVYSSEHPGEWRPKVDPAEPAQIELRPGGALRGSVVDGAGRPVAGARVYVLGPSVPIGREAERAAPVPPYLDRRITRAGPDGTFTVHGLEPSGSYWVSAWSPGMAAKYEQELRQLNDVVPREAPPLRIELWPLYRLTVRFVDAETGRSPNHPRAAVTGMSLQRHRSGAEDAALSPTADPKDPAFPIDSFYVATGEKSQIGPFRVSLGTWAGYEPEYTEVFAHRCSSAEDLPDPTTVTVRRRRELPPPGEIHVHVTMADGRAAQEQDLPGLRGLLTSRRGSFACALDLRPDGSESVRIDRLPSDEYILEFPALGPTGKSLSQGVEVKPNQRTEVDVRLPAMGVLRIIQRAVPSSHPTATVLLDGTDGTHYEFPDTSFATGVALVRHLLPGSYRATYRFAGTPPRQGTVEIVADGTTTMDLGAWGPVR